MPEGDALARAAQRLSVLVGEQLEVEAPNPRAAVKNIAPRLDGRRLESVEALGKNLFLRFEGGITLRSHLRMKGRWRVQPRGRETLGQPWLVLRGERHEAVLWHGPVLELDDAVDHRGLRRRLGPDILARPPDLDAMLRNLRTLAADTRASEALQIQRAVAGIGNMWASEALFDARVSPWLPLGEARDDELIGALDAAARLMRARLDGGPRHAHRVYRRKGRACPRCGGTIRSWPLGDAARMAYWCPGCQRGEGPAAE
jgi:formamidopyrimidine-DNA glycosylase